MNRQGASIRPGVQFRQLLCDLRDQGKALIVSSHILADMQDYCTHIGIMASSAMVQYGTVAQVAHHSSNGRCRYTVTLARPMAGLREILVGIEGISNPELDRVRAVFEYESSHDEAADLLATLVKHRVPVAAFTANTAGLEEAYLRIGNRQVD